MIMTERGVFMPARQWCGSSCSKCLVLHILLTAETGTRPFQDTQNARVIRMQARTYVHANGIPLMMVLTRLCTFVDVM